ncbi:MAG: hypothetical protein GYB20_08230 [Oceanospirillales bacterium]|nr:hypothetical protein [Oceanospirillales bacterium]MBR9887667.1 hypothetical protein [Oceanospirillales bacterium]
MNMSLRKRFLLILTPLGIIPLLLVSLIMLIVVDDYIESSSQAVIDNVLEEVVEDLEHDLNVWERSFISAFDQTDILLQSLIHRNDFISYLDKAQPEPLNNVLKQLTADGNYDFAILLDQHNEVLASSIEDIDDRDVAAYIGSSPLGSRLVHMDHTAADIPDVREFVFYEDQLLSLLKLSSERSERGTVWGRYVVKTVLDDFGEFKGHLLVGELVDANSPVITITAETTEGVFISFVDGRVSFTSGFSAASDLTREQLRVAEGSEASSLTVQTEDAVEYRLMCSWLDGITGQPVALICAGLSLTEVNNDIASQVNEGEQAKYFFHAVLLILVVVTIFVILWAAFQLSAGIAGPVKHMSDAMLRLAHNEKDVRIPDSGNITELEELSQSMIQFRDHALKRFEAEEEARIASLAKTEFLSSMSHELRTPLNAIIGFSQLLQLDAETHLNDEQKENVEHIVRGGQHLLALVNQVLDLSRIESGNLAEELTTTPARQVIDSALQMVRAQARAHNISLVDKTQEQELPLLWTDYRCLVQVLINLLGNAVKYNQPEGRVIVEVIRQPGEMLRISVTDTGVGIPADQVDKLFVPFERLNHANSVLEGSGVGLSICKQLMTVLKGDVGYDSSYAPGSRFWIDIPLSTEVTRTCETELS